MVAISRPVLVRNSLFTCRSRCIYSSQLSYTRPAFRQAFLQQRLQSTLSEPQPSLQPPPPTPTPTTSPTTPPKRTRTRRFLSATALFLLFFSAGLTMSVAPANSIINGVLSPPSNAETLTLYTPPTPKALEIDDHIRNHPLAKHLRSDARYTESRPHLKLPEKLRAHNLTGGTLVGEEKLVVPPLNFLDANEESPSLVQFSYIGTDLCGHAGIVHGGLLATLLDEGLARACFPALPNKIGVTANLNINYRKPCPAGVYVVLRAQTTKVEGRKAWVKGWIEILGEGVEEGEHLVEAEALFIEPRGANNMAKLYT